LYLNFRIKKNIVHRLSNKFFIKTLFYNNTDLICPSLLQLANRPEQTNPAEMIPLGRHRSGPNAKWLGQPGAAYRRPDMRPAANRSDMRPAANRPDMRPAANRPDMRPAANGSAMRPANQPVVRSSAVALLSDSLSDLPIKRPITSPPPLERQLPPTKYRRRDASNGAPEKKKKKRLSCKPPPWSSPKTKATAKFRLASVILNGPPPPPPLDVMICYRLSCATQLIFVQSLQITSLQEEDDALLTESSCCGEANCFDQLLPACETTFRGRLRLCREAYRVTAPAAVLFQQLYNGPPAPVPPSPAQCAALIFGAAGSGDEICPRSAAEATATRYYTIPVARNPPATFDAALAAKTTNLWGEDGMQSDNNGQPEEVMNWQNAESIDDDALLFGNCNDINEKNAPKSADKNLETDYGEPEEVAISFPKPETCYNMETTYYDTIDTNGVVNDKPENVAVQPTTSFNLWNTMDEDEVRPCKETDDWLKNIAAKTTNDPEKCANNNNKIYQCETTTSDAAAIFIDPGSRSTMVVEFTLRAFFKTNGLQLKFVPHMKEQNVVAGSVAPVPGQLRVAVLIAETAELRSDNRGGSLEDIFRACPHTQLPLDNLLAAWTARIPRESFWRNYSGSKNPQNVVVTLYCEISAVGMNKDQKIHQVRNPQHN
jgi:hypothetical protein